MLYPGSVKALLHDTTYAVCSPVLLIWGFLHVFSCDELCWLAWCMGSFSHKHSKGGRILNSALLAGDSCNMRCMLYPGPVIALLHDTTYTVCSPVLLIWGILHVFSYAGWPARQVKVFFKQLFMALGCTEEECL